MEHYPQSSDVQWHACTLFGPSRSPRPAEPSIPCVFLALPILSRAHPGTPSSPSSGNLGLSLVLLVRLHLHPEIKHGRTALLITRAISEFPADVRVQGAACGALWTLVMATGKPGQELAIRGGSIPLLVVRAQSLRC